MKIGKRFRSSSVAVVVLVLLGMATALAVSGCGGSQTVTGDEASVGSARAETDTQRLASDLSEDEQLLFIREEEKLARDVYLAMYEEWGVTEFSTIAESEVRHMSSVKNLLDRYGLEDPVGDDVPGVFVNQELQAAYDDLVALGSRSVEDAYQVGITIEELDIEDLQVLIDSSARQDVVKVMQNLLEGSQNHLVAFTRLAGE